MLHSGVRLVADQVVCMRKNSGAWTPLMVACPVSERASYSIESE